MHKMNKLFIYGLIFAMMTSCATAEDVQRAGELIRTDNELASLLRDNAPLDPEKNTQVLVLAHFAKKEADTLAKKNQASKIREGISYYRIAATAYWKSQKEDVATDLFASVEGGLNLCKKLGDRSPARDEMFLLLVPYYATYDEIFKNDTDIQKRLVAVNFDDEKNTEQEIELMKKVGDILIRLKNPIDGILKAGTDESYETHEGMRKYFCQNLTEAMDNYDTLYAMYRVRVKQYHESSHITDKTKMPSSEEVDSSKYIIQKPPYCN